eukprot:TRINITY_DN1589_c0_g1_i10.p1 TRINITY_DN1589_c0_g1~~TRINITY_DN1589_c0_g1_i10.p1  ORF type:complete len:144 (-),score=37.10 TRINITY_DN1589_c0_g1_i10:222-593(-)
MAPKAKDSGASLDIGALEETLEKWNDAKEREQAAHKEIEACKTSVEAILMKTGMSSVTTPNFQVDKRTQTRESVSKKDLPGDIWAKYAKTSEFSILAFKRLGKAKAKSKATVKAKAKAKGGSK